MSTGPIETKVKAATAGAVVAGAVIWALNRYAFHGTGVPEPVEALITLVVAGALTFVAGYQAKHTNRTDPDARQQ